MALTLYAGLFLKNNVRRAILRNRVEELTLKLWGHLDSVFLEELLKMLLQLYINCSQKLKKEEASEKLKASNLIN